MRYYAMQVLPQPLYSIMEFFATFGFVGLVFGLLIAAVVFFGVESKTAKDAATSYVAGFFLSFVSSIIISNSLR